MKGQLIVFEGPDGVGKSTLIGQVEDYLRGREIRFLSTSFPGKDPHTIGWIVNQVHHEPKRYDISNLTPLSLQALHIAAHLDNIESHILPELAAGTLILLDRFWWSTWVYGRAANVNSKVLDTLIEAEKIAWAGNYPASVMLVSRGVAFRPEHTQQSFSRLASLYLELAATESKRYPVIAVSTEEMAHSLDMVLAALEPIIGHW